MTAPIRLFFPLLLLLLGPQGPLSAQHCDCSQQFEWMRGKVASNYAGYRDKVTELTRPALDSLGARLSRQAAQAPDTACLRLMRDWLHFFRDGHLQISQPANNASGISADSIRARYARERSIPMTQQRVKQLLDARGEKATPIEGIWVNVEGSYRVAVLASPIGASTATGYIGIILRADSVWWVPGQIKFSLSLLKGGQYEAEYFMRDHTPRPSAAYTDGKVLTFKGLGMWRKVYPEAVPDAALLDFRSPFDAPGGRPDADFALRRLSPGTLLLRIPTFDHTQRHHLDSLLATHADWLSNTPNLLIDLRGNGGGSDISYQKVLPLIYTRPIRVAGVQHWATPDNASKYSRMKQDEVFPAGTRDMAARREKNMLRKPHRFIEGKDGKIKVKGGRRTLPQRVALLIDGGCASSCEQFVLAARQSDKVTLIGQATAGVLDYGNMHFADFPCGRWQLGWATSRSRRVDRGEAIDGKGIAPQVRPDLTERDWIDYARRYLEGGTQSPR